MDGRVSASRQRLVEVLDTGDPNSHPAGQSLAQQDGTTALGDDFRLSRHSRLAPPSRQPSCDLLQASTPVIRQVACDAGNGNYVSDVASRND